MDQREALMMIVTGVKRVGKSYETLKIMLKNAYRGDNRRKGLIFDINNEYGSYEIDGVVHNIDKIPIDAIKRYSRQTEIEVRRVVPIKKDGHPMDDEEMDKFLLHILDGFRGGILLVDDLNVVFGDSLPKKFSARLCNNAHRDCDIILHLQSSGRLLPKLKQNTNLLRFHHQLDKIDDSRAKLKSEYELFKIAQILVDTQYNSGNKRFFVYINRDDSKIVGAFNATMFTQTIMDYCEEEYNRVIKPLVGKKDLTTGNLKYANPQDAVKDVIKRLFVTYYGN